MDYFFGSSRKDSASNSQQSGLLTAGKFNIDNYYNALYLLDLYMGSES